MDFTKSSVSPPKTGSFLTQNKIPSEMLASYRPSSDFEVKSLHSFSSLPIHSQWQMTILKQAMTKPRE